MNLSPSSSDELLPLHHGRGPALRLTSWAQLLIVVALGLTFLIVNHTALWHTDIWAHLKCGQWIAEHRELPKTEPFVGWVQPAQPFQAHAWLSELALYEVFHL